jgi:hypothetical protein
MAFKRTLKQSVKRRVAKGIMLLNKEYGRSWLRKVDPETLALESGTACVLGQLEGNYDDAVETFGIKGSEYGFNTACDWEGYTQDDWGETEDQEYKELTATWRDQIRKLRKRIGI